jgi:phosphatidylethanolamine-binding protein (PEBP) family uncharacterized protein
MPPEGHGVHHYHFTLHALGRDLALPPGLTRDEVFARIQGHTLATAKLTGTYERAARRTA